MRTASIVTVMAATAVALAQQASQPQAPPPEKTFASAAEVQAMLANAKTARKSDQANFTQTMLNLAPYRVAMEYRVQGLDSPPTIHEKDAEMIYVIEGAGTLTVGGKLVNEKRSGPTGLQGTGIEGGTPRRIAKGDYIIVPEKTAHSFTKTEGTLVIMSVHVPRGVSAQ